MQPGPRGRQRRSDGSRRAISRHVQACFSVRFATHQLRSDGEPVAHLRAPVDDPTTDPRAHDEARIAQDGDVPTDGAE